MIDVRAVDGRIEIEPAAAQVTVELRDGLWVTTPAEPVPALTQALVDEVTDALRVPLADVSGDDG